MTRYFVVVVVLAFSACTDLSLPDRAQLSCGGSGDCPEGFVCVAELERCVDASIAGKAAIALDGAPVLNTTKVSQVAGFDLIELTFALNEAPADGPRARFQPIGEGEAVEVPCSAAEVGFVCSIALAGAAGVVEGGYELVVEAGDAAGNTARVVERVEVDLTAPQIAPGSARAVYIPGPGNPRLFTTAATTGTRIDLQLAVSETLGGAASARIPDLSLDMVLDEAGSIGQLQRFFADVADASGIDGALDVVVSLVDAVGNADDVTLAGAVVVDGVAPAAADTQTPGAVVFSRAPFGDAQGTAPTFSLTGRPGSAEPDTLVIVTTGDNLQTQRLGELNVDLGGDFGGALSPQDAPRVFLHVVDEAGNVSAPAVSRDVLWTAALAGKVVGDRLSNPHAIFEARDFRQALTPLLQAEATDPDEFADASSSRLTSVAGSFIERRTGPTGTLALGFTSAIFHPALGKVVTFGGQVGSQITKTDAFRALNGEVWEEIIVPERPLPGEHDMVYDDRRDRIVLFGPDGTWVFERERWRELVVADPPPAGNPDDRNLAYDATLDRVILVTKSQGVAQTWSFEDEAWTQLGVSTDGAGPDNNLAAMAWDPRRGKVVHSGGGQTFGDPPTGELWELDGAVWTQVATDLPVRKGHALVRDRVRERLVLVGGTTSSCDFDICVFPTTVHELDGLTAPVLPITGVVGLQAAGVAWDAALDRLVVTGGHYGGFLVAGFGFSPRTHIATVDTWTELAESLDGMDFRQDYEMGANPNNGDVMSYGGSVFAGAAFLRNDTTRFDGVELDDGNGALFGGGALAFDGSFMNIISGTQRFRLGGAGWVASALGMNLNGTYALAHDGTGALGYGLDNGTERTFRLNPNNTVTQLVPTTTSPGTGSGRMTFDVLGDRALLLTGDETWSFSGGDWTLLDSAAPAVTSPQLLYDAARDRVILVGSDGTDLEVHEFIDDAWTQRAVVPPTGVRRNGAAAYDTANGRVVYHGGSDGSNTRGDTWTWDGDVAGKPAWIFQARFSEARAAATRVLQSVTISATAGARGFTLGGAPAPIPGVDVALWQGGWVVAGTAPHDVTTPAPVQIDLDAGLEALIRDGQIHLAITPTATSGSGDAGGGAQVALDSVQLSVRYRE